LPVSPILTLAVSRGESEITSLLQRLAAADPSAVAWAYTQHHAEIRAFARRMLGDDGLAEDVVHDAFVALPAAIGRYRGEASLRTFLLSIAVNLCRHRIRSAVRQRRALSRLEEREVAPPQRTPESEAQRRRLADALRRGLDSLSVDHREAFVLCVVEERSSREAGTILGVPEGTVRTRVFHARARLRTFLEEEGPL
jgi:RNA polymerase sigma-70 factor, ECF subfamily